MTTTKLRLVAALVSPLLVSSGGFAQSGDWACGVEAEQFCADVEPGEGRVVKCLYEHASSLSAECVTQLDELVAITKGFTQICQTDIEQYCAGVSPGGGRTLKCLHEHRTDLSPECGDAVDKMAAGG